MAEFDRIDLMNFLKYGNDFDEQWDEIRNYIKSNPAVQRELEEIRKLLPQSTSYPQKRRSEPMERPFSREVGEETRTSPPNPSPPRSNPGESSRKWWSKLLGDD